MHCMGILCIPEVYQTCLDRRRQLEKVFPQVWQSSSRSILPNNCTITEVSKYYTYGLFNPIVFPKMTLGDKKNMLVTGTHKNRGVICTLGRLPLWPLAVLGLTVPGEGDDWWPVTCQSTAARRVRSLCSLYCSLSSNSACSARLGRTRPAALYCTVLYWVCT